MDGRRFDDMSRLIGAGGSRRRLLRLIVGSALAVPGLGSRRGASRAQGCLGEGQPCVLTSDCCDDGIDELTCVDAVCAQPTCTGEMEDCGRYGPCCSGACVGEGALVCVTITCDDIGDCPTNATGCIAGVCIRGTCDVDFFCPPGLTCVDGRCVESCADLSAACGDGGPSCCGDLSCVEGVCAAQVTCAPGGASCMADVDCCDGLTCADGACRPPIPGNPDPVIPDPVIPPEEPASDSPTLPNTGIGQDSGSPTVGIMFAGGLAALLASRKLRSGGHAADLEDLPTEVPPSV